MIPHGIDDLSLPQQHTTGRGDRPDSALRSATGRWVRTTGLIGEQLPKPEQQVRAMSRVGRWLRVVLERGKEAAHTPVKMAQIRVFAAPESMFEVTPGL